MNVFFSKAKASFLRWVIVGVIVVFKKKNTFFLFKINNNPSNNPIVIIRNPSVFVQKAYRRLQVIGIV
jgi:hypothetical protein